MDIYQLLLRARTISLLLLMLCSSCSSSRSDAFTAIAASRRRHLQLRPSLAPATIFIVQQQTATTSSHCVSSRSLSSRTSTKAFSMLTTVIGRLSALSADPILVTARRPISGRSLSAGFESQLATTSVTTTTTTTVHGEKMGMWMNQWEAEDEYIC